MLDSIKTTDLFMLLPEHLKDLFDNCAYPWQIVQNLPEYIKALVEDGVEGFIEYSEGVIVGKNVKIDKSATIIAPAVIGSNTEIRVGAYLRGNTYVGKNCVVGNSTELKNCVLLDNVQTPHYNYVGDSVLGYGAHLGAGTICSNLKADKSEVVVKTRSEYKTGLRKLGAMLGDGADIGSGCVLNPGTVIGRNTSVYPLTAVRGVVGDNRIVKSMDNIVIKKDR